MNTFQLSIQNIHGHKHSADHHQYAVVHHSVFWHTVQQPIHFVNYLNCSLSFFARFQLEIFFLRSSLFLALGFK